MGLSLSESDAKEELTKNTNYLQILNASKIPASGKHHSGMVGNFKSESQGNIIGIGSPALVGRFCVRGDRALPAEKNVMLVMKHE